MEGCAVVYCFDINISIHAPHAESDRVEYFIIPVFLPTFRVNGTTAQARA